MRTTSEVSRADQVNPQHRQGTRARATVDRASPDDVTTLVTDRGPAPMNIGAALVLADASSLSVGEVRSLLEARIARVPRLRQRLRAVPPGCGRPIWVDDPHFDLSRHLSHVTLPAADAPAVSATGDRRLLDVAVDLVCTPLPRGRPLWAARWVTGLPADGAALVLVMHHALTDGVGGLAVLAALSDGWPGEETDTFPHPPPTTRQLVAECWRERASALASLPARVRTARHGLRELGILGRDGRARTRSARLQLATPTAINRPTGPKRRLTTVERPLSEVLDLAHARGCTLNDVILTAVTGAVATLLRHDGGCPDELVISVPISSRRTTSAAELGNRTGVVPLTVPTLRDRDARLDHVAGLTRTHRSRVRGSSAAPMGALFRGLARLGLFRLFIEHQRLVHTFVTNVRGPAEPVTLAGRTITGMVPIAVTPGNAGVTFDVLSYAGRLVVTLVADPVVVPDQDRLTRALEEELTLLTSTSATTALNT